MKDNILSNYNDLIPTDYLVTPNVEFKLNHPSVLIKIFSENTSTLLNSVTLKYKSENTLIWETTLRINNKNEIHWFDISHVPVTISHVVVTSTGPGSLVVRGLRRIQDPH